MKLVKKPLFWIIFSLIILFLVFLGIAAFKYISLSREISEIKNNPAKLQELTASDNKNLINHIGSMIVLPDETPTVATVADLEKLKDQPFFAPAKIGDKVLIFSTAKKAILFRPSENKIIDVAPVNIGSASAAISAPPTVIPTVPTTPTPSVKPRKPTPTPTITP